MQFLFGLADTISVIHWGQVIASGAPAALRENKWCSAPSWDAAVILEVAGIETFYGETQALFGVSLEVGPGEVVALLGPTVPADDHPAFDSRLTPARNGVIRFDGRDITRNATHEIARLGIGWVPDDRRIFRP